MTSETVKVVKNGPVTTIIIRRPKFRNAVDGKTADALSAAFQEFEKDKEAKVAVLAGDGGTFCAGADLQALATDSENRNKIVPVSKGDGPMGPSRMKFTKPVIAAVSGFAVAGGLELALLCDLRVVEEDAIMGVFCRRWGVPLIDGGTVRLPRLIGLSRALDMILTGRGVNAKEAMEMGLANRVVPKGQARQAAEKLANEIAAFPQVCVRADRQSAYEQFDLPFNDALQNEMDHGMKALLEESVQGASKFKSGEGRHGSFKSKL